MSRTILRSLALLSLVAKLALLPTPLAAADEKLDDAYRLIQTGRYEEGLDLLQKAADQELTVDVLRLRARALREMGDPARAAAELEKALKLEGSKASTAFVEADLATLALERGDVKDAVRRSAHAYELDPDSPQILWVHYRCLRAAGDYDGAQRVLNEAFVLCTHRAFEDPWDLLAAGRLLQEYAGRHLRDAEQAQLLNSVLNDFFDGALAKDSVLWQARYLSGHLFVSKYRSADAERDLQAALDINPSAASVYVALGRLALNDFQLDQAMQQAEAALELNPHLPDALALKAAVHLARAQTSDARLWAKKAVEANPAHWEALAILCTAHYVEGDHAAYEAVIASAQRINPRPVRFYYALGRHLEDQRVFDRAESWLWRALEVDADFNPPRAALGMLLMRVAREDDARPVLEEAFSRDPFSVRVKNTLEVLDLLDQYAEFAGQHVRIKVDGSKDKVLGMVARWYLDRTWQQLTDRFGYSPKEPALVEVFNRAKGHTGHQWFSARTIGLPWIGTVGACTGKVVAMVSPLALRKPFNWGRVLRHELTHVITLQQTNFNITHWFTEALAVDSEGFPRPRLWDEVLIQAHRSGELLDLSTINAAFIRPGSQARWALAYCQAKLYLDYMRERFGPKAAAALLRAYAEGHRDPKSVEKAFNVTVEDFETGYRHYIDRLIQSIVAQRPDRPAGFAELERAAAANPQDARLQARLALAYLQRRGYRRARDFASKALDLDPNEPLALYVLARLYLQIGEDERAEALLEKALDEQNPEPHVLALLADRAVRRRDLDRAERLYKLGYERFPADQRWLAGLARVALLKKDRDRLKFALERLALADPDDLATRVKLAQLAEEEADWRALERWAWEVVLVHPMQRQGYRWLRTAAEHLGNPADAAEACRVLAEVDEENRAEHLAEAVELFTRAGRVERAQEALDTLRKAAPDHPLLQKTKKGR